MILDTATFLKSFIVSNIRGIWPDFNNHIMFYASASGGM
jgi:hypothetical protein